jgi:hypothetical protein
LYFSKKGTRSGELAYIGEGVREEAMVGGIFVALVVDVEERAVDR